MKSIKTPNHPAYHWSTLWPLEVWVGGLHNSWWFCVHKLSMFLFIYGEYGSKSFFILDEYETKLLFIHGELGPSYSLYLENIGPSYSLYLENIGPSYSLYLENIGYWIWIILDTEPGKYWIPNL